MSRYRVYIKTFESAGVYDSDFQEVSDDVISIGAISQGLDNSTYDIGIFKNSGTKIRFRNDHGRFSEAEVSNSIFRYKRQDSIIKITWSINSEPLVAGFFHAHPYPVGGEVTIFEGLLTDVSAVSSIDEQFVDFRFSGYESLFDRVTVPYDSISNGDTFSQVIYKMLNQSAITTHLTVDQANIVCAVDEAIDDKSSLEAKTVREALDSGDLLLVSSSTLYIRDNTVFVQSRDETPELKYTFYGQAAQSGIENIINVKDYRDGYNKIFNFVKWRDSAIVEQAPSSISKYGSFSIELDTDLISIGSTAKISNILAEIKNDFSQPKREMKLETPINYQTIDLFLKDKVKIDYPTIYTPADDNPLPIWGTVTWGNFSWPLGQFSLLIDVLDDFKIMSMKINLKNDTIIFDLREV